MQDPTIERFEKELKDKIKLKTSTNKTELTILLKAFKYFDLNESGTVEQKEFKRVVEKLGANLGTNSLEDNQIFKHYSEGREKLDYKQFSEELVLGSSIKRDNSITSHSNYSVSAKSRSRQSQRSHQVIADDGCYGDKQVPVPNIRETISKIRSKISDRGMNCIIGLGRLFRAQDKHETRKINRQQFATALHDYRVNLNESEVESAFEFFSAGNNNELNYDDFLLGIRGPMNDVRRNAVSKVFSFLDKDDSGFILLDDLQKMYLPQNLLLVKRGILSSEEAFGEFLAGIDGYYVLKGFNDGKMTKEEFDEFYSLTGASLQDDDYFEALLKSAWIPSTRPSSHHCNDYVDNISHASRSSQNSYQKSRLTGNSNRSRRSNRHQSNLEETSQVEIVAKGDFAKKSSPAISKELDAVAKIKSILIPRGGMAFIGLQRQFSIMDDDKDGHLDYREFSKAIKDYRVILNETEIKILFDFLHDTKIGKLSIAQFVKVIVGEMSDYRKSITLDCFKTIDKRGEGLASLDQIKQRFTARRHPEVTSGMKTQDEVLAEFIETLDVHHLLKGNRRDHRVSKEEFISYYNNISVTIPNDKDYELMMRNSWRMPVDALPPGPLATNNFNIAGQSLKRTTYQSQLGNVIAPFGVDKDATNYKTSKNDYIDPVNQQRKYPLEKTPAGITSWPGRVGGGIGSNNLSERYEKIMIGIKDTLVSRGVRAFLGLHRLLKLMDTDHDSHLNYYEFSKALTDSRIHVTEEDNQIVYDYFDRQSEGLINLEEFLRVLRGRMPEHREALVDRTYEDLARKTQGLPLTIEDIRLKFNAENHPDVDSGRRQADIVTNEFLEEFEIHHLLWTKDPSGKTKTVAREEFLEFYDTISAISSNDLHFEQIASKVWIQSRGNKIYRPRY